MSLASFSPFDQVLWDRCIARGAPVPFSVTTPPEVWMAWVEETLWPLVQELDGPFWRVRGNGFRMRDMDQIPSSHRRINLGWLWFWLHIDWQEAGFMSSVDHQYMVLYNVSASLSCIPDWTVAWAGLPVLITQLPEGKQAQVMALWLAWISWRAALHPFLQSIRGDTHGLD